MGSQVRLKFPPKVPGNPYYRNKQMYTPKKNMVTSKVNMGHRAYQHVTGLSFSNMQQGYFLNLICDMSSLFLRH